VPLSGRSHTISCREISQATMADMWKCHKCGEEWLTATTPACLECGHPKCSACPPVSRTVYSTQQSEHTEQLDGASGPQGASPTKESFPDFPDPSQQDIDEEDSLTFRSRMMVRTLQNHVKPRGHHLSNDLSQPSMAGWWRCCSCWNDNNPKLTVGYCSVCGHRRDSSCIPLR
jgi:hypothetical protein